MQCRHQESYWVLRAQSGDLQGGYILLAVLGFSLPVLIGAAAVCVYTMIAGGLIGMKLHVDETTQRVLKAEEILAEQQEDGPTAV